MSDEIEVDDDIFLEEGVLYCTCGTPVEAEEASGLLQKEAGREYIACPSCDVRHFAESGKFRMEAD
jgi:DNA-directed RNA polymerase subunit RPC12/RpoP